MLEQYEKNSIAQTLTTPQQDTLSEWKATLETQGTDTMLCFDRVLTPSTNGFTYAILLCPELNWAFIQSLYGSASDEAFVLTKIIAAFPTLKGTQMSVAFVKPDDLQLNAEDVGKFVSTLLGTENLTEKTLKTKGVMPVGTADGQLNPKWFSSFGPTAVLQRNEAQLGLKAVPMLLVAKTGLKCVFVDVAASSASLQSSNNVVYIPSQDEAPESIEQANLKLHIFGAILVQGVLENQEDAGKEIYANWNFGLGKIGIQAVHRTVTIDEFYINKVISDDDEAKDHRLMILLEPFDLGSAKSKQYSFAQFPITYCISNLNVVASSIPKKTSTDAIFYIQFKNQIFMINPSSNPSVDSITPFMETEYVFPLKSNDANTIYATVQSSPCQEKAFEFPSTRINDETSQSRMVSFSSFDAPSNLWLVSGTDRTVSTVQVSQTPSFRIASPFVPSAGSTQSWQLGVYYLYVLDVDYEYLNSGIGHDVVVKLTVDYDCIIDTKTPA